MSVFIDVSKIFIKELKKIGWVFNEVYHQRGKNDPRILKKNGVNIMVAVPIQIDELRNMHKETHKYFTNIHTSIDKLSKKGQVIKEITFQSGGTVPIPDYFKEFCDKNNVEIKFINEETVYSTLNEY